MASLDQPSCDGINSYFVCREAKSDGLTVALSGQGGDEVFAGYPSFRRAPRAAMAGRLPRILAGPAGRLFRRMSRTVPFRKLAELLCSEGDLGTAYGLVRSVFWDSWRCRLLRRPEEMVPLGEWVRNAAPDWERISDPVNAVSYLEQSCYLRNTLLRDMDAVSMANSLEVRVPFLDHRLVAYVARVAGRHKLDRSQNKRLLTEAVGTGIPAECLRRRKQGFFFPWRQWIVGELKGAFDRAFSPAMRGQWEGIHIDPIAAERCYHSFLSNGKAVHWAHVWSLFSLLQWQRNRTRATA
jgi:asparagine synthase (glutamine-hydrolysing)